MVQQKEIIVSERRRGAWLITSEIVKALPELPRQGLLHLFIKHTSAALAINENADPDVRTDLAAIFDHLVPENAPYYLHTFEGPDDMPAHAKSVITGPSVTIPICNGRLSLGTWQGIYLLEFRNHGGARKIMATAIGE